MDDLEGLEMEGRDDRLDRDLSAPPHDLHAEEAVLGAVLKRPSVVSELLRLQPQEFYDRRYGTIWRAMLELWHRNVSIDYITLDERLKARDYVDAHLGLTDLLTINLSVPSAANVGHYVDIISKTATQRRYIAAAQSIAEVAWRGAVELPELVRRADELIGAARPSDNRSDLYDPERWATTFMEDLEARMHGQRTAVTTGLLDLDQMTLGLEAGGLYLVQATPGVGKTELACQIAMHVSATHGPVLFASLEMSVVELAHRYARISTGMDRNRLVRGDLNDDEMAEALQVINAMREDRFWPSSPRAAYTTSDLRADVMEMESVGGHPALIVADYVQRFRDKAGRQANREQDVAMIAENLKSLAREFASPVLAPVQPNRDYVTRANKRPLLSDLRESGRLEAEADVVLGLYRDELLDPNSNDAGIAEVHMLKNRSGAGMPAGTMRKIVWLGNHYGNYAGPAHARRVA